jgi:DNA-binding GntR family transcriptional regulator
MQSTHGVRGTRRTAVSRVHGSLLRRISSGDIEPGTRLREEEVARRHGVSRTPVREAFRRLEAEGFVTVLPHAGAQVSEISLSEIDELFEIRGALEVLAAQRAALNADAHLAERLRAQLRRCEAAAKGDVERLIVENERLHSLMYDAARSPQLVRLIDSLGAKLHRSRLASLSLPDRPAQALKEHGDLVAAIVSRDAVRARELASEHAERGRRAATHWYLDHHRVRTTDGTGGRS